MNPWRVGDKVRRKFHSQEVLTIVGISENVAIKNEIGYFHAVSWVTFATVYESIKSNEGES